MGQESRYRYFTADSTGQNISYEVSTSRSHGAYGVHARQVEAFRVGLVKHPAEIFADFGMTVAKKAEGKKWFRGYGIDQYVYYAQEGPMKFLGGAFEVESYEDLEK